MLNKLKTEEYKKHPKDNIYYMNSNNKEFMKRMTKLTLFVCPICEDLKDYLNIAKLKSHLENAHNRFFWYIS
jgi:hypothetical protein